ncbi:MAG: MFS transporter [Eggerthellaceae bacterium]|nr:MFS transporter [Eggerthellaceae bacterium]
MNPESSTSRVSTGLAVLLAAAAGLAIGNLYWAQPLLAEIAADMGVTAADCGLLVTATQVGYAIGVFLVVPLGDVLDRKRMVPVVMVASVAALAACAFAPGFSVLAAALALLGLTTVSGQVIVPLSSELSGPSERGRVVGIVSAGITGGILAARALSGLAASAVGWRGMFAAAAVANLVMAFVLYRKLPDLPKHEKVSCAKLIGGVFAAVVRIPAVPRVMAMSGLAFGVAFNLFWNGVTYLLSADPFAMTPFQIGLVSLAGVTGTVCSIWAGHFQDAGRGIPATGAFLALCAATMALALPARAHVGAIVAVAAVYSFAIQGVGVLNQTRLFSYAPEMASRLNTAFVVNNFVCAATGSALSSVLWNACGWTGISLGGFAACFVATIVWFCSRHTIRLPEER